MTISYQATAVWQDEADASVWVQGKTMYRIVFDKWEAHVIAPGLNITVELDSDIYPDDPEAAAVVLIAQLEGGMEL